MKRRWFLAGFTALTACFLVLASCSLPLQGENQGEMASFTVSLGGAPTSRQAADYPPDYPEGDHPGHPKMNDLRIEVKFLRGTTLIASFDGISGTIAAGTYTVEVEVWVISPSELYATGTEHSVTLIAGINNPIIVNVWEAGKVTISPSAVSLNPGDTEHFTATVSAYTNQTVTWSLPPGHASTIDTTTGILTINDPDGTLLTVTATSVASTKSSTATVTVVAIGALTGSVTITGNNWVGQQLTADTSNLGGSGTINYQWQSGPSAAGPFSNIGTNDDTYILANADNGQFIQVVVTRAGFTGSITSTPPVQVSRSITINVPTATFTFTPIVAGTHNERSALVTITSFPGLTGTETVQVGIAPNSFGLSIQGTTAHVGPAQQSFTLNWSGTGSTPSPQSLALTLLTPGYTLTNSPTVSVDVIDGLSTARSIPVNQANIMPFNAYATNVATATDALFRNYSLTGTIALPGTPNNWIPIGTFTDPFIGVFNGNGNIINNLVFSYPTMNSQGLFGAVGTQGTVRNLILTGVNITAQQNVGGVAGRNDGLVENCSVTGSVSGRNAVGGVVGANASNGIVQTSNATANVTGTDDYGSTGGIVGANASGGVVRTSYHSAGNVIGVDFVGGVVGANTGLVENCYATGTVRAWDQQAGGVVGRNQGNGIVRSCYASGIVYSESRGGGVVGRNADNATIINCVALNPRINNTGGSGETLFGPVAGESDNPITGSRARANMTIFPPFPSGGPYVGEYGTPVAISTSYATVFSGIDWNNSSIWNIPPGGSLNVGDPLPTLVGNPQTPAPELQPIPP